MKGLEKLLDAVLDFLEENPDGIVEGFDMIVAKMIKDGKLPHSSKETPIYTVNTKAKVNKVES